jgi:uncharacterized protein
MHRLATAVLATTVLLLPVSVRNVAGQSAAAAATVPEIVTSASAERPVQADLAVVTLRFSRDGVTPVDAGRNLAVAADSVRRALGRLGIAPDSVINSSRWSWWRGRVERVQTNRQIPRWVEAGGSRFRQDSMVTDTTFRAHEALQVRVRNLERVGSVIDVALALGITDISDVSFSATNTEHEHQHAIRDATTRARARAEAIASAAGSQLGRTLRLSTEGDARPPQSFLALEGLTVSAMGGEQRPGQTVVVAPVLRVTATVHGRWQLVEAQ